MNMQPVSHLFDVDIPVTELIPVRAPERMTPTCDANHFFSKDLLKLGLMWIDDNIGEQNLLITGPKGAGKSSFISQLCARLGIQLWRVACHGRLEFQELVGGFRVVARNGGTDMIWVDGPLVSAARVGGVLLLDEGNFLSPSALGALNTVLDGSPILIPETGELVIPARGFRVAFTGNAVNGGDDAASHKGIQRMNTAFLDRFLCGEVDYLPETEEAQVLNRTVPDLEGDVIQKMVKLATAVRKQHKNGEMEATLSTRVLCRWGNLLLRAPSRLDQKEQAKWSIDFAHLAAIDPVERSAIHTVLEATFN